MLLSFNLYAMTDKQVDSVPLAKVKHTILKMIDEDLGTEKDAEDKSVCYKMVKGAKAFEPCPTLDEMKAKHEEWKAELKAMYGHRKMAKKMKHKVMGKLRKGTITKAEQNLLLRGMIKEIQELKAEIRKLK